MVEFCTCSSANRDSRLASRSPTSISVSDNAGGIGESCKGGPESGVSKSSKSNESSPTPIVPMMTDGLQTPVTIVESNLL